MTRLIAVNFKRCKISFGHSVKNEESRKWSVVYYKDPWYTVEDEKK